MSAKIGLASQRRAASNSHTLSQTSMQHQPDHTQNSSLSRICITYPARSIRSRRTSQPARASSWGCLCRLREASQCCASQHCSAVCGAGSVLVQNRKSEKKLGSFELRGREPIGSGRMRPKCQNHGLRKIQYTETTTMQQVMRVHVVWERL